MNTSPPIPPPQFPTPVPQWQFGPVAPPKPVNLFGGLGCYLNPACVAALEVAPAGSEWRVRAVLNVTDRTGQPAVVTVANPVADQAAALALLDETAALLGAVIRPAVHPDEGVPL